MSRGLFGSCGQSLYRSPRPSAACPLTRLPRHCAGVREPARTERRCERQTEPGGLQRARATGQVRTRPARPGSRRRSGLPTFSESGYTLDVIPFEPEPTDGARLDALRRRLGDTSCRQRGHMTGRDRRPRGPLANLGAACRCMQPGGSECSSNGRRSSIQMLPNVLASIPAPPCARQTAPARAPAASAATASARFRSRGSGGHSCGSSSG